ncbi:diguanylate cyclase/phosphodiesterase (GGDEF & EAL domains) with PAS/PAC sensor(s) [hydrothermal vent metagenome]|uniref:Diguanylate cyclase/phosphodiesterase (GGDEF & EAL domains) with PAS/PAC sensor(S) n=1 Tax=hydrothermal vent metagenome TaxID=652676 RepID=A0A3B1BRD8_9ZZZZ
MRYILALGLIALLSISAYLSLYKVIKTQETSSSVINVSGRQRMLSQRAALFAFRLAVSESKDERMKWRRILRDTASLMEISHNGLTRGSSKMNLPFKLSPTVRAIYFDPPVSLDNQVRDYLARIKALLTAEDSQLSKNNPDLKYILSIAPDKLLSALDAMVRRYETESIEAISKLYSMERFVLGLTLLVLMMEAMFIFRPAVRQIREYTLKLLTSEKQVTEVLQTVLDTVGEGIITVDDKDVIVRANNEALDMWGYPRSELIGTNLNKLIPSISIEVHDFGERTEVNGIKKDGAVFPIEVKIKETQTTDKVLFTAAVHDITERKQAEETLKASELRFRETLENVHMAAVQLDTEGKVTFANDFLLEITGWGREEVIGESWFDIFIPPETRSKKKSVYREIIANNGEIHPHYENFILTRSGGLRCISWNNTILRDNKGNLTGVTSLGEDITERKRTEEELTRLGTAIEQAKESIVITDSDGDIQFVNPAFEKITGYSREETIGQNPRLLKSGEHDEAFYKNMWDTITKGGTWTGHFINKMKNGDLYEEEATITPVLSPAGEIINYIAVKRDVTKEANLERQARQSQKMESIGTLAGGIAHDFNNLLTPIIGYIEMVLSDMPEESEKRDNLAEALDASLRARELVKQILTFSVKKEQKLAPIAIHSILKQSLKLVRSSLPATIEILDNIDEDSGVIMADPVQIDQLVMNMCANAGYAMQEKGDRLSVVLIPVEVDEAWAGSQLGLSAGSYILFSITDTGIGMSKEVADRIFDPFFTTKPEGEGTGMGLATVHGIVKAHKGVITVESQPGEGATFNIFFPKIESQAEQESERDFSIPKGDERILLVDDEKALVKMGKKILERIGYQVQAVSRSSKALEMFQDSPDEFDLLLTDQTMPGISGSTLAMEIRKIRPNLPVIICTGLNKSVSPELAREIGIQEFILKPYTTQSLAKAVRRALDCEIAKAV